MAVLGKIVWQFLKKIKIELPMIQQSFFWVYIQRKWNHCLKNISTSSCSLQHYLWFAKMWQQPNCPLKDEWIQNIWYIYIYIYSGILLIHYQKRKFCHLKAYYVCSLYDWFSLCHSCNLMLLMSLLPAFWFYLLFFTDF